VASSKGSSNAHTHNNRNVIVLGFCFPVFGQFPAFEHRKSRELGTGTPISPNKGMKKLTASQLIGQRGEFLVATFPPGRLRLATRPNVTGSP
jgi:hypothetical protein